MSKKFQILLFCLVVIFCLRIEAQVAFKAEASYIGEFNSNISVMSADLNNDQQDDLMFFNKNQQLVVSLNNGLKRSWRNIEGPPFPGPTWSGLVADFNNDGFQEIVVGTSSTAVRIYTFDYENEDFTLYWQCPVGFLVQNMNASDVDNDGFLDLFMCNDLGTNFLFRNDQNSGFVETDLIDFNTVPASDNSGNYGSVFVDFDLDGDRDLYISKCRAGVDNPEDPRRINQLFVQQDDGSFIEMAADFGLDFGAQTWVADFADLDIDGDLDLVVANHGSPIQVLRNDNGVYTELLVVDGLDLDLFTWQLSFHDFDNDQYPDILISADDTHYFHNNGDWTFTEQSGAFGGNPKAYSHSVGDYNNDGFLDILTAYGTNPTTPLLDSMWLNQANDNHWIAFVLEGEESSRDAEGTRVDVFSEGNQLIRHVKIGHSYGIQDTKTVHVGLGQGVADSVKIYWTNSAVQTLVNPQINRKHFVKQMGCVELVQSTVMDKERPCKGEEIIFSMDNEVGFQNWQDGSTGNSFVTADIEAVYAEYGSDCQLKTWVVYPEYGDTSTVYLENLPVLDGVFQPCPEELIILESQDSMALWNGSIVGNSFPSKEPGIISLVEILACQTMNITFLREDLDSDFVIPEPVIKYEPGQDLTINVESQSARWYEDEFSSEFFYQGPSFTFESIESNQTVWIENYFENSNESQVGLTEIGVPGFTGNSFNPRVFFEVDASIGLQSIKVYSNVEGERRIVILDSDQNEYYSESFYVQGETILELDVQLVPGEYEITTDQSVNLENLGTIGPILARISLPAGAEYPFVDELGVVSITGSSLGQNFYYSFFDWKLDGGTKVCDPRYSVQLEDVLSTDLNRNELLNFNNPIANELLIQYGHNADVKIFDLQGNVLYSADHEGSSSKHDVSFLLAGSYLLKVGKEIRIMIKI